MRILNFPVFGSRLPGEGGSFGAVINGAARDGSDDYVLVVSDREVGELEGMIWSDADPWQSINALGDDGRANTAAMALAGLQLARLAGSVICEGHSDYFIPSALELRALQAAVSHIFEKAYHWSSSALPGTPDAWTVDMERGLMLPVPKYVKKRVRLVRRIALTQLFVMDGESGRTVH